MNELYRYVGADVDVPAGDIGVGAREVGYMYGQYKRLTMLYNGVFTGKGLDYGGSLGRKQATGYGLLYFVQEMLKDNGKDVTDKRLLFPVQAMWPPMPQKSPGDGRPCFGHE